jgi:hypothetical protein
MGRSRFGFLLAELVDGELYASITWTRQAADAVHLASALQREDREHPIVGVAFGISGRVVTPHMSVSLNLNERFHADLLEWPYWPGIDPTDGK